MNIKKSILNNYYINHEINHILPHSISRYFQLVYRYVFALFLLFCIYFVLWEYISQIKIRFGVIWVFLYLAFVYSFSDIYLDTEMITNQYLVILNNNGFVWSSTNYYDLDRIDSVSFEQNWRIDYILDTWVVSISTSNDQKIYINHIHNPQRQVQQIIKSKNQYILNLAKIESDKISKANIIEWQTQDIKIWTISDDKFNILVDSLSEIVSDYIKKWVPDHTDIENNHAF